MKNCHKIWQGPFKLIFVPADNARFSGQHPHIIPIIVSVSSNLQPHLSLPQASVIDVVWVFEIKRWFSLFKISNLMGFLDQFCLFFSDLLSLSFSLVVWCFMAVVFLLLIPTIGVDAIVGLDLWFWWFRVVVMGGGDTDNGCCGCVGGWVSFLASGWW